MRKTLTKEIEIPKNIQIDIVGDLVSVNGPEGEIKRIFKFGKLKKEIQDDKIIISYKNSTKKEKKTMNTITAHIKNMIKGAQKKFEYKLKAVFSHFPMTVEIAGNEAKIKNFLGEKVPRKVKLPKGIDINIDKEIITISSINKEVAGQAAAKFEAATKVGKRDRRVFQDGIYITNKAGKII